MPELELTRIDLDVPRLSPRDAHKLRGYIGDRFAEHNLLHNHLPGGGFRYAYPLVQYKILDGRPALLGVNQGGQALQSIFLRLDELRLADRVFPLSEKKIQVRRVPFGASAQRWRYRFYTPWLAINQKNHLRFRDADGGGRRLLLQRVLAGNLLSFAKALDCFVTERLQPALTVRPASVRFKDQTMIAFLGVFEVNFLFPPWLGLGKSCSRGFGAVAPETAQGEAHPFPGETI